MSDVFMYTLCQQDGWWFANTESHGTLVGKGTTEYLALNHLKQQIRDLEPYVFGLYETSNIGSSSSLRGVCIDEDFARAWVAENDPRKTWESRRFGKIPLLESVIA